MTRTKIIRNRCGISGMALSVPDLKVDLSDWCRWFNQSFEKIRDVVGSSYRLPGPMQNVYTLAASASLKLIRQYDLDPRKIGFFALGTESSMDNAIGSVIVRGMIDLALKKLNLPTISRHCEVPEFKHACLGGIYAIKNALRYLVLDGRDKLAIVVSGDVAKYELGSSGEATQGSGAVAVLLEANAKLMSLDLMQSGKSSRYRGVDFRKPFAVERSQSGTALGGNYKVRDFPVFNGAYSVACYIESMLSALEEMFERCRIKNRGDYFRQLKTLFMHRPYKRLPRTAWSIAYLISLGHGSTQDQAELQTYCDSARVDVDEFVRESQNADEQFRKMEDSGFSKFVEPYPLATALARSFRKTAKYQEVIEEPMELGSETMQKLGNLYTASLPGWMAAGLHQASKNNDVELAGQDLLMVGYGSGDASEVIPCHIEEDWREAASLINADEALQDSVPLSKQQYVELHSTGVLDDAVASKCSGDFVVSHTGCSQTKHAMDDRDVEYYDYRTTG